MKHNFSEITIAFFRCLEICDRSFKRFGFE